MARALRDRLPGRRGQQHLLQPAERGDVRRLARALAARIRVHLQGESLHHAHPPPERRWGVRRDVPRSCERTRRQARAGPLSAAAEHEARRRAAALVPRRASAEAAFRARVPARLVVRGRGLRHASVGRRRARHRRFPEAQDALGHDDLMELHPAPSRRAGDLVRQGGTGALGRARLGTGGPRRSPLCLLQQRHGRKRLPRCLVADREGPGRGVSVVAAPAA